VLGPALAMTVAASLVGLSCRGFVGTSQPAISKGRPARLQTVMFAAEGDKSGSNDRMIVKVLTPEGPVIQTMCSQVVLPGVEGQLGILRGHAPLLAPVATGVLKYLEKGQWVPVVVFGGYASVDKNVVTVLSNDCQIGEQIPSLEEAQQDLESATAALSSASSKTERLEATQNVKAASARIQAATMNGRQRKA